MREIDVTDRIWNEGLADVAVGAVTPDGRIDGLSDERINRAVDIQLQRRAN